MAVARLLFLANYRVPHALFSLQWDHYLQGIDHTIVASPVEKDQLWPLFDQYGIDVTGWHYVNDAEVYRSHPEVNNWMLPNDYRTTWLRQQAIKMAFLDLIREDVMLMHDPDTFAIEPYRCVNADGTLNFFALKDVTQGSYEGMFKAITGLPRQTSHCFVTELVPVKCQHFQNMIDHICDRYTGNWLDAIITNCPSMPTVPPWGQGEHIKWFSEYEFLGNWSLTQEPATWQWQKRFEYAYLDQLRYLDTHQFNAVCDAVPDLQQSMVLDWQTGQIPQFDQYREWVNAGLST